MNVDLGVAQPIEAGRRLFQNPSKQETEDYMVDPLRLDPAPATMFQLY